MSSRLHRDGGLESEPMLWRRAAAGPASSMRAVPESPAAQLEARLGDLEAQAEQRARGARQQGFEEGQAAARQEAAARADAALQRLARSVEELSGLRQRLRREAEQDVVALALAVARRVLHRELTVDPDALLGLVKAALEKLDARELHRVRVHPEHAGLLRKHLEGIGLPRQIEVTPDPGLERGAAVLETARGELDASIETQLAEIERGFADLVEGRS